MVDNGSTDGTAQEFRRLLPRYPFAKVVTVKKNRGYGYGILQGLKASSGDYLGWTHADLQTDPKDTIRAIALLGEADGRDVFIKGVRRGRPIFDRAFSACMGLYFSLYLKKALYEINAQPTIFSRSFFGRWQNPPDDFSFDLYAYYLAKTSRVKIVRIPVSFAKRVHGHSHWSGSFKSRYKVTMRAIKYGKKLKMRFAK